MRPLSLLLLLLSGCIPISITITPAASGTIIDASTGQPLADAEVFISRATYNLPRAIDPKTGREVYLSVLTADQLIPPSMDEAIKQYRRPVIITGSDGHFFIPAKKRMALCFPGMDFFTPTGSLIVRRNGYLDYMRMIDGPKPLDLAQIPLRPRPSNLRYNYGRE